MTRAVRMHPREGSLWIIAGRRAALAGDMTGARGWFMRGCRFADSVGVWVEYARCEMEWLAKVERKKGGIGRKGLAEKVADRKEDTEMEIRVEDEDDMEDQRNENGELMLDNLDGDAGLPKRDAVFDEQAVKKLERSPALDGAIPLAIYDISLKERWANDVTSEAFFDMFTTFTNVSSQPKILQHVLDSMAERYPKSAATYDCWIRRPLVGVDVNTPEFPRALQESLARLRRYQEEDKDSAGALARKTLAWVAPILANTDLDVSLRAVLEHFRTALEA